MEIVHQFNRLSDEGTQIGTLLMPLDSIEVLARHDIAKPAHLEKDAVSTRVRVYFFLAEFEKYLKFACHQAGLTLLIDGRVQTSDGLFVDAVFPQDAVKTNGIGN